MARPKGSLSKDKGRVLRAIRNYAGDEFDPAVKLIELAMAAEDNDDLSLASQNYARLMEFCYPKLKSQDLNLAGDMKIVAIDMTGTHESVDGED